MRALGIDFGTVRIGVAITDENKRIASALTTITYPKNNYQYAIDQLRVLLKRYNDIDIIVLGYPALNDGNKTSTTLLVDNFYSLLLKNIKDIQIVKFDEAYSTKETISMLKEVAELKISQIKKIKDKLSAQRILQNYIERK